jgi:hypothetical protein
MATKKKVELEALVLALLEKKKELSVSDIAQATGMSIFPRPTRQNCLSSLKQK